VIDVDRLATWMDEAGLQGKGEPLEAAYVSGGSQNEIYEIRRGELHGALRIPPPTAPANRDDGILREWRIIEALDGTDVPCTPAIGMCADTSVLGRAFYIMGFVDGWSPMNTDGWPAPFDTDLGARQGLAYQLVEGIALLANVDWRARGLHDLGRPDGFHERQVDRWTAFLERIKGRELPGFDVAAGWLRANRPINYVPGLMHGDYQFANVMFEHGAPATPSSTSAGSCRAGPRTRAHPTSRDAATPTSTACRPGTSSPSTTRRRRAARSTTSTTT
jgi:aminoglycoside phosphotransferase (APT) family kinase protein